MSSLDFCILSPENYAHYIQRFNQLYPEDIINAIPDREAWGWMRENLPFLDSFDKTIEEIYYFRWWIYRKHIRQTSDGFVVSEFLPSVGHAKKHNTINCPVGHHLYEGRWIKNPRYLDEYILFMLSDGDLHQYSCWFADAVYQRYLVNPDDDFVVSQLTGLQDYFHKWQRREEEGLFHYTPWMDGMEYSVSGNLEERFRPTLNSYMYGDALAVSRIASIAGASNLADTFSNQAVSIKEKVQGRLWNTDLEFFATRDEDGNFTPVGSPVREAVGFIPWYFNLPDKGYEAAWRQVNDPQGFCTPVGLTSCEVRHPQFMKVNPERLASWDGAIWPYATSQTLTAMQNLLRNYHQSFVTETDYLRELGKYAASHTRDGKPSISEVLRDPYVQQMEGSEHYNHSTFCDLIISGLAGILPRADDILEVHPLLPQSWDNFCLDGVQYHGHLITIFWDKDGTHYGDQGFHVLIDRQKRCSTDRPAHVTIELS